MSGRGWVAGAAFTLFAVVLSALGPIAEQVPAYLLVHLLWLSGLLLLLRWPPVASGAAVLLWALLMRLPLVLGPPASLSDDIHRYVWEGRVVARGGDPWDTGPLDPSLVPLRAEAPEWASINHKELPAIYPPVAQWIFAGLHGLGIHSARGFRAAMVAFDLLLVAALLALLRARGRPAGLAILYAWNPLAVVEVASSGHYEPLALLPVVLGLWLFERRRRGAWALWGLAFGVKLFGVAPAWFAARRLQRGGRARTAAGGLVVAAVFALLPALPFSLDGTLPLGSLGTYAENWGHNGSIYPPLAAWLGYHPARRVVAALFLLWAGILTWRAPRPAEGFVALFAGLVILSPVVHPWYGLWLAVFLPLFPRWDLALLSGLLPLSYLAWTAQAAGGPWEAPPWVPWLEYGLPAAAWAGRGLARRGP